MADFLDDTEEDLRQQQKDLFFLKVLPYVIGVSLIAIVILGSFKWSSYRKSLHDAEMGDILYNGINNQNKGNSDLAIESFDHLISKSKSQIAEIGILNKSAIEVDESKSLDQYKAVAETKHYNNITRYYAMTQYCLKKLDQKDQQNFELFDKYAENLISQKSPFQGTGYLIQLLKLIKLEKFEEARDYLENIQAPDKEDKVSLIGGFIPIIKSQIQEKVLNESK